ncbi:hypothetical protein H257_03330 [Aphanomyces astaci]|uniref:START domain-containing protein n=1 Tax=Aphanomyces astaci TaxID=112090 RepID=W4GX90_APHAT|nr:hypothetical protein H257_03330 [Aphanomyces astaci]ETV83951.1 hypothetical protein H257_03330 [Aphanomyces astaci]|eukprot:XP_009825643.1 hypothetical protein H257_03330 [Aphanomyces astaci]
MDNLFDLESFLDEHETQKLVEFTLSSPEMTGKKEQNEADKDKAVKKASVYYRERRKNEVDYLVSRKRALEVELLQLHERKVIQEAEAKRRKREAETQENLLRDAEDQNSSLRDKLLSQMETLKLLESFFMSQSALCVFARKQPTNPLYFLPSDPQTRERRFRDTIATALSEVDSVMASKHLSPPTMPLPHTETFVRFQPQVTHNSKIEIEVIRVVEFPGYSVGQVSDAIWRLIHYQLKQLMHYDTTARCEVLEEVDPYTFYSRYQCQFAQGQPLVESYSICHRTMTSAGITFVYRCFLDDERYPAGDNFSRHDENGYLVVYANPSTNVTTAKMVSLLRPLANAANAPVGLVTEEFMGYLHDSSEIGLRILHGNLHDLGGTAS